MATTTVTSNPPDLPVTSTQSNNTSYFIESGDGGVRQATQVPDLTSIPDSDTFAIVNESGQLFNFRQKLVLADEFRDVVTRQELPKSFSQSNGVCVMEWSFTTPGYIKANEMILNIPLNITADVDLDRCMDPSLLVQAPFALLNNLDKYEFKMGSNNYQVGNMEFTSDLLSIKTYMGDRKMNMLETELQSGWGLPFATTGMLASYINASGAVVPPQISSYNSPREYKLYQNSVLSAEAATIATTQTMYKGLSLASIIPMFDQDCYLPPGLPLNLKLFFKQEVGTFSDSTNARYPFIMGNKPSACAINVTGTFKSYNLMFGSSPFSQNGLYLLYEYKILSEKNNSIYNQLWFSRPLLYNHFDYKRFEFPCNGSATYDLNITWNKQKPTGLYYYLTLQDPTACQVHGMPISNQVLMNLGQSYAGGYLLNKFEVYLNGVRTQFYNSQTTTYTETVNANDYLLNLKADKNRIKFIDDENQSIFSTQSKYFAKPLYIKLDTSEKYQFAYRGTDAGSTNIRISLAYDIPLSVTNATFLTDFNEAITVTSALTGVSSAYKMCFLLEYPVQTSINSHMQITQVEWPAITSGNNKYIQQTINTN